MRKLIIISLLAVPALFFFPKLKKRGLLVIYKNPFL